MSVTQRAEAFERNNEVLTGIPLGDNALQCQGAR